MVMPIMEAVEMVIKTKEAVQSFQAVIMNLMDWVVKAIPGHPGMIE